jgi:hypothetical protein
MPEQKDSMNADDFRAELPPQDDDQTIQDPFSSPPPSYQQDPNLSDLADKTPSNSQNADADKGDDRYRHQQSRADKAARLNEEQARKISDLESQLRQLQPIVEMLEGDEELARHVDQRLATRGQSGPQMPQRPTEPTMPEGYNEAEAFTNPQSESYKYRKAREKYFMDNQKYLENVMEYQQRQTAAREQALAQQQYEQRRRLETHQRLVRDHQLTPVEAQDFMNVMSSEDSVSLENLVGYWRFLRNRPTRNTPPPPPQGGGGGGRGAAQSPNEMFNDHLFEIAGKPRRRT